MPPGSSHHRQAPPSHINPLSSCWNSLCPPPSPSCSLLMLDLHSKAWFPQLVYTNIATGNSGSWQQLWALHFVCEQKEMVISSGSVSVTCEVSGVQLVWETLIKTIQVLHHWSSVAACRELRRCHGPSPRASAVGSHSWCQSSKHSLLFLNPWEKLRNKWHLSCTSLLGMQVMDLMTTKGNFKSETGTGSKLGKNFNCVASWDVFCLCGF